MLKKPKSMGIALTESGVYSGRHRFSRSTSVKISVLRGTVSGGTPGMVVAMVMVMVDKTDGF